LEAHEDSLHDIDIITLPEMAFLNYYFTSKEEIEPFLEL
jgi:hypothetical protein